MQPAGPTTGRSARLALVAFALLGLLAIVAFASKSGISRSSRAEPTPGYVSYAFTAFLIDQRRRRILRRRKAVPLPDSTMAEDLVAEMTDAIEDLEAEPDARRAVIAAYARMEGVLARHGLRRRPSETPLEYLRRILLRLTRRADAVQRLTAPLEQAQLSRPQ